MSDEKGKPFYLGYSMHWGLHFLRENLARKVIVKYVLEGGSVFFEDSGVGKQIQMLFASIGENGKYENSLLHPIIDATIPVERIFFHTVLATGAERLLYHGDDVHTSG